MYVLKVTIAATNVAQRIIANSGGPIDNSNTAFQSATAQNNGTHTMWLGDYAVTTNNGLQLTAQGSVGASQPLSYASDLKEFYVYGTQGDVLNIMVFP